MRQLIKRALAKTGELKPEQIHDLLFWATKEITRFETVLDSLPRGILVSDTNHNLIMANKAARRFLSIVPYEQARESIWNLISDERVSCFISHTLLSADKAEEREFDIDIKGLHKLLSVSIMPLVQDRQVTGSLVLVDDITERKARDAKLRRMESLASLTTLAAGVAHEIKNPLGALSIHVQLIQKTLKANPAQTENDYFRQIDKYLSVVNEEIDRLNAIVVDFLFAVRPMNSELKRGDINVFVAELAEFVSIELKDARIELVLNLEDDLPAVDFDPALMKQALLNLIKNAAAAMSDGGKLTVTTEAAEEELRISIADTGAGIPEENLHKIFEPYFTTKDNGTGLGLTVVFKIIKEHHGEVNVKSRKGEGSVFVITLPIPQLNRRLLTFKAPVPIEGHQ